jgi:hypothetical protein
MLATDITRRGGVLGFSDKSDRMLDLYFIEPFHI